VRNASRSEGTEVKFSLRWLFNLLAGFSFLLFLLTIVDCFHFISRDDDWAMYFSIHGRLICVDTFEDLSYSNAINLREFDPWPSSVPFQFVNCAVEGNTEIPFVDGSGPGAGSLKRVWLDKNNQPIDTAHGDHLSAPMTIRMLGQLPIGLGPFFLLTPMLPLAWVIAKSRSIRRRRKRSISGLCVHCGYDLRATPNRCPECGTIPAKKEAISS
jgi:hypothetical protein